MKTMTFIRDFISLTGGHLKVYDYFNHVAASDLFSPALILTPRSLKDTTNPWIQAGIPYSETFGPSDAYFVGGVDWEILDEAGIELRDRLVINLVQHVRHASPQDVRYRFLTRPALRICVSEEVAEAVRATGLANGDVIAVPNGLELNAFHALHGVAKEHDVFIGGLKSPELALACADRLGSKGLRVSIETGLLPREEYIQRVATARIALLLPNRTEGFYLPALEAMASDVCVVVPDCIGNRSFCLDGVNCVMPAFDEAALTQAVLDLVARPDQQEALKSEGRRMAASHDLLTERARFFEVLSRLGQ